MVSKKARDQRLTIWRSGVLQLPSGITIDLFMKLTPEIQKELIQAQKTTVEGLRRAEEQKQRSQDLRMMAEILGLSRSVS